MDHYADRYWNELPQVLSYMCRRATGDPTLWWMDYFKREYAGTPFRRGLVIACGNGWVERDLIDRGVALHFDAYDPNPEYVAQANAQRGDRSIDYYRATFTDFDPPRPYDLVVNVAALHHARRLYETVERIARSMTSDGLMVSWDYVGPSRNQYSRRHLALMEEANRALPPSFRSPYPLRPRLLTIIAGDPTEAAHSSEIRRAVAQYFSISEWNELGGGIAYQILWNNLTHFETDDPDAQKALARILDMDDEQTSEGTVPSLFAFFVARRRRKVPGLVARYDRYVREPVREAATGLMGNVYFHDLLHRIGAR